MGHVERETYAAASLVARMEDAALDHAPLWDDIASFDGRPWRGAVDIVTAGYPCQPFSVAGKRRGADDPRHLWPHVARIIGEVEPPFVFLENVAHHLRLGFPEVAAGLVGMGYRLAAGLFTAAEVGAPHRRERLFILAIREGGARSRRDDQGRLVNAQGQPINAQGKPVDDAGQVTEGAAAEAPLTAASLGLCTVSAVVEQRGWLWVGDRACGRVVRVGADRKVDAHWQAPAGATVLGLASRTGDALVLTGVAGAAGEQGFTFLSGS